MMMMLLLLLLLLLLMMMMMMMKKCKDTLPPRGNACIYRPIDSKTASNANLGYTHSMTSPSTWPREEIRALTASGTSPSKSPAQTYH